MPYRAPVSEFSFLLDKVIGFKAVQETERFAEASPDMVSAVLTEAGRMCDEVMAPLQRNGDLHPAVLSLVNACMGMGFLSLPYAFARAGLVASSAVVLGLSVREGRGNEGQCP